MLLALNIVITVIFSLSFIRCQNYIFGIYDRFV